MLYLDDAAYGGWDDVLANEGNAEGTSRRSRRGITEVEEEFCGKTGSEDSDYTTEIIYSDYDLNDGDDDLINEDTKSVGDENKRTRAVEELAEDPNSEDDSLDLPESDDDDIKFNFRHFTEVD